MLNYGVKNLKNIIKMLKKTIKAIFGTAISGY